MTSEGRPRSRFRLAVPGVVLVLAVAAPAEGQSYFFTHLAGSTGGRGWNDGTGSAARFYWPCGVAVDGAGNVYAADTHNHTIRKITPADVVTTLAGEAGSAGSADGTGSAARFYYPVGVTVDGSGNVYVADAGNSTIRKITPAGVVTTLAGQAGSPGSADGAGSSARFHSPSGVAADGSGNVYVADADSHTIRKVTPAGVVTTLAGQAGSGGVADGTGSAARFYDPNGVAVDRSGNVYVADTGNNTIREVTADGVVRTLAGLPGSTGSTDGTGSTARFYGPTGVAVDGSGNVYVADSANNTIRKVTSAGMVTTLAGQAGSRGVADGTGSAARFYDPNGVAVDRSGNVYVADTYNHAIRKVTPDGIVTTLAGQPARSGSSDGAGGTARFNFPTGVAVDRAGTVYVADSNNDTIRKITPAGVVTTLAGLAGSPGGTDGTGGTARFKQPYGVAVDGSGNVFVSDSGNYTIRKITPAGDVTTVAGEAGNQGTTDGAGGGARFFQPTGVAVDESGNVYVADRMLCRIRKVTPAGVVTTLAGQGTPGSEDGTGSTARFQYPQGVAVDGAGNLYVADTFNHTIRRITPGGVVTTLAGKAGSGDSPGFADGTGSAARFKYPTGVAVDGVGNVYVADSDNQTIRKVTPAGVVTTLAGQAGSWGSADGTGDAARFYWPSGVAVDEIGSLYVADYGNNAIRKGVPATETCVPDAFTACLIGGRYRVTSHWQNQYAGGEVGTLSAAPLTETTAAFWLFGPETYEYMIRINTATDNGRAWISIPTFTDVEFWVAVTDTVSGQYYEYHSPAGNRTLIYDPYFFVYP
jgi:hypothetical protein